MPLEPKYRYSAAIYAEILSVIGTKIVELAGPTSAIDIFSKAARPGGEKDAKELIKLLGINPGNAASAALAEYATGCILGIKSKVVQIDPKKSILQAEECPYGNAVSRYKHMLICYMCTEYSKSMAAAFGATYNRPDKKISTGQPFCEMVYECLNPADQTIPNRLRIDIAVKMARVLADKNELMVSTLSDLMKNLEEVAYATLGKEKAIAAAKNAYAGGAYQGPTFAVALELKGGLADAAKLISGVRETTGCKTGVYLSGGGFAVYTKKCPQKEKCASGGFLQTACIEYTRGLLSGYGNFEIKTDSSGPACKQDLIQTSPQTENKVQNAA